jgi:hypothetical protein
MHFSTRPPPVGRTRGWRRHRPSYRRRPAHPKTPTVSRAGTDSGNIGEVQFTKGRVVRDVEEYAEPRTGQAINYAGRFAAGRYFAHYVIAVWKHGGGQRWEAHPPYAEFPLRTSVKPPLSAQRSPRREMVCQLQLPSACLPRVSRLQPPWLHANVN